MLSGASFGLIPLFTLPLMASGMVTDSILFYRFTVAALLIAIILVVKGESFRISWSETSRLILLGLFYMSSAMFLLWGYEFMAAGIATAVHFLYPVCVVVLMALFFGERVSIINIGSILLAIIGVALLSGGDTESAAVSGKGMAVVVISSLAYALYIISIKKMKISSLSGFKLTFYVLLITGVLFFVKAMLFGSGIQTISSTGQVVNILLLAIVPTIISNFALVKAVHVIGSTTASILGAMEPLTAVIVGVTVFAEPLSLVLVLGIVMIIGAVVAIVGGKKR